MDFQKIKLNHNILVLNSDYNPINICTSRRAIVLLLKRKAQFITEKVIRLLEYIKLPLKSRISSGRPTRNFIYKRDNYKCSYCKAEKNLTIDHIIPTSRGGSDSWENMCACCNRCNVFKGNRTPEEAGMRLQIVPKAPFNKLYLMINTSNVSEWKDYVYS